MKTSFAKTFLDLSRGELPTDGLHGKEPTCIVKVDGNNIPKEEIFVIESMNRKFESTKLLTLLVDIDSMNEYNELNEEILSKKKSLVLSLNRASGIKKEDARCILPAGTLTTMYVAGNFQAWIDFLKLRLNKHAQSEVRKIAFYAWDRLKTVAPLVFDDLLFDGQPYEWWQAAYEFKKI